jgi:amidohydrolase
MNSAVTLRRELHRHPELSGCEQETAARIARYLVPLAPDKVVSGLGGAGCAFVFGRESNGPTVMLRCELDALPIQETGTSGWRSENDGIAHQCGHDGHMAILAAVAEQLSRRRPQNGRVVLLFQPAEETGAGARQVVADPAFAAVRPDLVFGLHNVPGRPLGEVIVRDGTFCCASRGMHIRLQGRPAHAAQPETGLSPAVALTRILDSFAGLPGSLAAADELMFATIVGVRMGGANFGVAPGAADIFVTLRAETDAGMQRMVEHCEQAVHAEAGKAATGVTIAYQDVFAATVNAPPAVDIIRRALQGSVVEAREPFRWSEDFGCYTQLGTGAFFGLGAGVDMPDLHNEDYDFPDALIERGAEVFMKIIDESLRSHGND